jgi:hypothetical protein
MLKTTHQWSNQHERDPAVKPDPIAPLTDPDDLVAELTDAAYRFALRHGFKGTFVELELGLWDAIRARQWTIKEFASALPPSRTMLRSAPSRTAANTTGDQR